MAMHTERRGGVSGHPRPASGATTSKGYDDLDLVQISSTLYIFHKFDIARSSIYWLAY